MRYRDGCMPLVSSVHTVYYIHYDLRVAQLTTRTISPLVFHVENLFPVFRYTLPLPYMSQTKACV